MRVHNKKGNLSIIWHELCFLSGTTSLYPSTVTWPHLQRLTWAPAAPWWTFAVARRWSLSASAWSRRWPIWRNNLKLCCSCPPMGSGSFTLTGRCVRSWDQKSWSVARERSIPTASEMGMRFWWCPKSRAAAAHPISEPGCSLIMNEWDRNLRYWTLTRY